MKRLIFIIGTLLISNLNFCQESSSTVKFIAGFPDFIYQSIDLNDVFISGVLKVQEDSLVQDIIISDSLQRLCFLRSYSENNIIIAMIGSKSNPYDVSNNAKYKFVFLDTRNNQKRKVSIPSQVDSKGLSYIFNPQSFNSILKNDEHKLILTYNNLDIPKNGENSRVLYYMFDPITGDLKAQNPIIYREAVANGNSFILKNNNEGELLQGDIDSNTLRIPTNKRFFEKPNYIDVLPNDVTIKSNYYAGKVLINNESILVLYLYEKKNQSKWNRLKFRILDKEKESWDTFEMETSIVNMKSFGRWLGGNYKIKRARKEEDQNSLTFNKEYWGKDKTLYGPSYTSLMESDEGYKYYSKGNLYVYNIDSQHNITWETGFGDSEVLLVNVDEIYYRVECNIYKASIIDGERLGKPVLIISDERVGDIHWAFISNK